MNLLLPSSAWFTLVLIAFVVAHVSKWKRERNSIQSIKHKRTAWIRVVALTPSTIGLAIAHPWEWYIAIVPAILIQFFWFWFLFDGLYNVFRVVNGKRIAWFSVGTIDKDEAATDNFIRRNGQSIKIAGCILSTLLYLLTFLKYKFVL